MNENDDKRCALCGRVIAPAGADYPWPLCSKCERSIGDQIEAITAKGTATPIDPA